jgi:acyl-CoA reductase-like NAD-dependent aldehyde dehydrogenase
VTEVDQDAPIRAVARIGSEHRASGTELEVIDPYRGGTVGFVDVSGERECAAAVEAAVAAAPTMAALPGYERAELLRRCADELVTRAADIGRVMARETGKAIRDCIVEAVRSADTFRLSAEEAVRIQGEHIPMDASAIGAGKLAVTMRFPVGVVAAIAPFNGPLNLAAHKIGPALAGGNTVVLKPSPKASLCTWLFVEALAAAGVPAGAVNAVYGDAVGEQLVVDPRVDFVTFTGSIPVGKLIRRAVGLKPVTLELGGVGPTFVHHDGDLAAAAVACARNGMLLAGQSCVSVQNVFVAAGVYDEFLELLNAEVARIRFGDPLDPQTEVGTLIDEAAAARVAGIVDRAVGDGARIAAGGERVGALHQATVLTDVTPAMEAVSNEIFGPVVTVSRYEQIEPLFQQISNSPYGLQCGIFTKSIELSLAAVRSIRTGGVIVNGTSRWRSDQMPYGGVKDSGVGREGPKFALREMTEERLLVLNV